MKLKCEPVAYVDMLNMVHAPKMANQLLKLCVCRHQMMHEPEMAVTRPGGRQRISNDKVHIEYLHISQLLLTLSFIPSPGTQATHLAMLAQNAQKVLGTKQCVVTALPKHGLAISMVESRRL